MARGLGSNWEAQHIPDDDDLYMRVHRSFFRGGELIPGAFRDHGRGMSTDWAAYSTPEATRSRTERSAPEDNAVIALGAGQVRAIPGQSVEHTPDRERENYAHADIVGDKKAPGVRLRFLRIHRVVLALEA